MKILIVDDEKLARDRLKRLIESMPNFQVVASASNVTEALAMATSTEPDIVLMDIRMPGIDGIQAARLLYEMVEPPAVIFTTAYSDHALEAFEAHAVDYLLKPVKKERLQAAIEAATKPNKAQVLQANQQLGDMGPRQHICARVLGRLVQVPIYDIIYFNVDQKYVYVRYAHRQVVIYAAMYHV